MRSDPLRLVGMKQAYNAHTLKGFLEALYGITELLVFGKEPGMAKQKSQSLSLLLKKIEEAE